jgi:alpha-galactosidase
MRDALYKAGRPIVFSLCEWGNSKPWEWAKDIGHLWRTTGDIAACFDCVVDHGTWNSWGVMQILDMQKDIRQYAGPDHWNDPDMMEVGNGMSIGEDRAHFSMWCMLAAPLMAGNDISGMTKETQAILTNTEVIAIDQDPLGIQGYKYMTEDSMDVWLKPLSNNEWAICFLNRSTSEKEFNFIWNEHNLFDELSKRGLDFGKTTCNIRDLWAKETMGTTGVDLNIKVPGHDVKVYKLVPLP